MQNQGMLVLALDTTTKAGGVALVDEGRLLESSTGDGSRPHAERLPGDLLDLLGRHGRDLVSVDLFAVAAGPGSFTGLRIGIATMQGLAMASGRPLVGVSALEALAFSAASLLEAGQHRVAVWLDAQRGEVFSAVYEVGVDDRGTANPSVIEPPESATAANVANRWRHEGRLRGLTLAGAGAHRYRDVVEAFSTDVFARVLDGPSSIAPAVAQLGRRAFAAGGSFLPHAIRPLYVRRPDAELARDRQRRQP